MQDEKGMTEDEMVGWHLQLDGHEFKWALGVGDGQGSLVCCSLWGCKELDTTEQLNWTDALFPFSFIKKQKTSKITIPNLKTESKIFTVFLEEEAEKRIIPNGVSGTCQTKKNTNMSWSIQLTTVSRDGVSLYNPNLLIFHESFQAPKQSVLWSSICQRYP